jgi:hypothetical protein
MKTSKLLLFVLILSFYAKVYSADIFVKSKTENTMELSVKGDNKTRSIVSIRESSEILITPDFSKAYKNSAVIDLKKAAANKNNFIAYDANKSEEIKIISLKAETKYIVSIFDADSKKSKDIEVYTLAVMPKKQTSGLAFKEVTESQIGVLWLNGDGKERMICITGEGTPAKPENGKMYKSGKFGDNACKIENSNTYVVFNTAETKTKNQFLIKGLDFAKYTIQMFEYNGKGESTNYLTDNAKNNPRIKHTLIPAPTALAATNLTIDGFTANWKEMKNVKYFEFDLSTDPAFSSFVDLYQSADVGNLDKVEIVELKAGTYYYRLRAISDESKSNNSNVIKLEIK